MSVANICKSTANKNDMKKINLFSRRELKESEVYIFSVNLCSNDIDRDFERFSVSALKEMAPLFIGKTGISDHSMKSSDQKARIFDAYVEKQNGKTTADGEELYCLKARAYILKNDENRSLIEDIDGGIKKEVSVSCSVSSERCSICGKNKRSEKCEHIKGKSYSGRLCFGILENPTDAYEFSFVAVPAQRDAGVIKSFTMKEENKMNDIISTIKSCDGEITLSKSQANEIYSYIENLKEEAKLGEDYKKELSKEVTRLFAMRFPNMDKKLLSSVVSVMTTKELLGFKDGLKENASPAPQPQLISARENSSKKDYSQFRI